MRGSSIFRGAAAAVVAALVTLPAHCAGSSFDRHVDLPYEETIATRLAFKENPSLFPVLPFSEVAHTTAFGSTSVAVLARSSSSSSTKWKLYAVDTAVIGPDAVSELSVPMSVPLEGSCITSHPTLLNSLVVVGQGAGGVFRVDCKTDSSSISGGGGGGSSGDYVCHAEQIVDTASFDPSEYPATVTACDADGFGGTHGTSVALVVASPDGFYAGALEANGSPAGWKNERWGAPALPDGEAVLAVAVAAGWGSGSDDDDTMGFAVAFSTRDHLYYGADASFRFDDAAATLPWREEWVTTPDESGGAVDWLPAPGGGLAFQLKQRPQYTNNNNKKGTHGRKDDHADAVAKFAGADWAAVASSLAATSFSPTPLLWVAGGKGLQVLDMDWHTFRRLDGESQGLPNENLTAVALAKPAGAAGAISSVAPSAPSLWAGDVTGGVSRRLARPAPSLGGGGGGYTWRYYRGARWMPSVGAAVTHVATARQAPVTAAWASASDAACASATGAVVVTNDGLSVLAPQCWTLAAKAAGMETPEHLARYDRYGLMGGCDTTAPGQTWPVDSSACTNDSPSDNDGLWTSIYTASQVFKAAALAQEQAESQQRTQRQRNGNRGGASDSDSDSDDADDLAAWAAFNASLGEVQTRFSALKFLYDVTGRPGVPARSYAKYGEVPLGPVPGDDNARAWYNSTTYPGWIWKGDTSSDEIVGHVFVQSALATLVPPPSSSSSSSSSSSLLRGATDGRRHESSGGGGSMAEVLAETLAPVRADAMVLLAATLDGIVAANYTLIDPGLGTPTTWGRWDPYDLNGVRGYSDERGLNSAQILAFLRAAGAWTSSGGGDESSGDKSSRSSGDKSSGDDYDFDAEADALKADYGYGVNAVNAKITTPGDVNFSDDELLMLPLYTHAVLAAGPGGAADSALLKDPEVACGFARAWEQGVAAERSALWATMHAAAGQTVLRAVVEEQGQQQGHQQQQEGSAAVAAARAWVACGGVTALDFDGGVGQTSGSNNAGGSLVHVNFGTGVAADVAGGASTAHGGAASLSSDAGTAAWSLQAWPLEPNNWNTVNSLRSDVVMSRTAGRFEEQQCQNGAPLPPNERSQSRWNGNPWVLDSTTSMTDPGGTSEADPGTFLLPYWMARYHGLVGSPSP